MNPRERAEKLAIIISSLLNIAEEDWEWKKYGDAVISEIEAAQDEAWKMGIEAGKSVSRGIIEAAVMEERRRCAEIARKHKSACYHGVNIADEIERGDNNA